LLIEEVMPDKSSRAAGQVFEPDRPHKSLHTLGRRLKTKVLVTALEVTRRPDMPSKPVWGRELPGGFDSRPPPLPARLQPNTGSPAGRKVVFGNNFATPTVLTGGERLIQDPRRLCLKIWNHVAVRVQRDRNTSVSKAF
jgi:hypothetical protein